MNSWMQPEPLMLAFWASQATAFEGADPFAAEELAARRHATALEGFGLVAGTLKADVLSRFVRERTAELFGEMGADLSRLSLDGLKGLMTWHEARLARNWLSVRAAATGAVESSVVADLDVAARFVLETAAANAGGGSELLVPEILHKIWAAAIELLRCGGVQEIAQRDLDVIFCESSHFGPRLAAGPKITNAMRIQAEELAAEAALASPRTGTPDAPLIDALNETSAAHIGLSVSDLVGLLGELATATPRGLGSSRRDELLAQVAASDIAESDADRALDYLSLSAATAGVPADKFPWRFRRELSALNRPLVDVDVDGQRWLLFGPVSLAVAARALADGIAAKTRTPTQVGPFNDAVEAIAQWRSRRFESAIAEHFSADGRFYVETGVENPLGTGLIEFENTMIGDLDVVVIDPVIRLILLIEAKGRAVGFVPATIANEKEQWPSIFAKHHRRMRWLASECDAYLKCRGREDGSPLWRVAGHIVVRAPMASTHLLGDLADPVTTFASMINEARDDFLLRGRPAQELLDLGCR